MFFFF
jgi:hypothetical protein